MSVTSAESDLSALITAVTVFPDRARVTRRGTLRAAAGEHRVTIGDLPLTLRPESVRVAGRGPATVLGVDVARQHRARTEDEVALDLTERLRSARAALAAIDDQDALALGRLEFLDGLSRRAARAYAKALPAGGSDPAQVAEFADALGAQQAAVREQRRSLADGRERAVEEIAALERSLQARQRQREPDRNAATVALAVTADAEIDLELSYVVDAAGWQSAYDVRLDDDALTFTWFGLVTQRTGEDWPECDLRLSTARPSSAVSVPELKPWFLDRLRPLPPPVPMRAAPAFGRATAAPAADREMLLTYAGEEAAAPLVESVATHTQGATAATYQPPRPVAVPADGGAHRATIAVLDLQATRDYVTAPVLALEAHLRATVTNSTHHTLPPGTAAVFHGGDFVGSAALEVWAPGEEIELALGVDDRIRVERELVRRTATKAMLGVSRRRESEHKITVTNHTPGPARVTVLDQLPVSRDDGIVVKEQRVEPTPAERTEMGVLTWVLDLPPGESREVHLGLRVEEARGVQMVGWRE